MLKYINYQLHQDEQQQAQLEQVLSAQINQNFTSNVRAFSQHIPSVVPFIQQHDMQQYSIFCTRKGELNIVDYATGRVWYGDSPYTEVAREVQSFCQQAPYIEIDSGTTSAGDRKTEPLPAQVDVVVMFGLGLGYQLSELIQNVRIKYLIVYEPSSDALLCSVQANNWKQLLETAAAMGTQIFLQLQNDGSTLPEDLQELLQVADVNRIYLYRHYFHPVMDKVLITLFEHSGDKAALTRQGQHFGEFDNFYDYLPERAGNVLGNLQLITADNQPLFQHNLDTLKQFYPEVYQVIKEHQCSYWQLVTDTTGQPNLQHKTRNGLFYNDLTADSEQLTDYFIHNPYKDDVIIGQKTSTKLATYLHSSYVQKLQSYVRQVVQEKSQLPEQVDSLIVFGVGLGKHISLLTAKHNIKNLYICEPNLDFFFLSLFVTDWAEIFKKAADNDSRIYLNLGGDGSNYFTDLMLQFYKVGAYSIANTYMLSTYFNRSMQKAIYDLRMQLRIVLTMGEYFDHVRFGVAHTCFSIEHHRFLRKDWHQQRPQAALQLPVFIVANGPSLDNCFDYLHKYRDQAIIISCGTALRALHRNGIQPDFHAEVEQNRATYDWISQVNDPEYLKGIRLISVNGMHPDTSGLFRETLLAFKQGESSTYIFQNGLKEAGAEIASLAYAYPTVTNLVVNYLLAAGFRLLYLFGVDLGYADINYHHSKFSAYYKPDGKEVYDYKDVHGDGIPTTGNFRPVVFTQPAFDVSRKLVEQALLNAPATVEVYNCSDGAKIAGAPALAPENILLPGQITGCDKQQLLSQFLADAYFPVFTGKAEQITGALKLETLQQSVEQWLQIIAEDIDSKEQASALIEAQWQHLRHCAGDSTNLCFYLFYGSSNYILGILTKLMAGMDDNPELVISFNEVLELWRSYLAEAVALYISEPLSFDGVSVNAMFNKS
ncbi:DUF115 domain-containing protein [Chromatiaceae bacterium AAb-1]|nr:DUF115 domain-containing protein [Chromatiaceae bacterium AAb-1]